MDIQSTAFMKWGDNTMNAERIVRKISDNNFAFAHIKSCIERINFCNTFLNNNLVDREEEVSRLELLIKSIVNAYNKRNKDKQIVEVELSLINKSNKIYFIVIFDDMDENVLSVDEFCDYFKIALDPLNVCEVII